MPCQELLRLTSHARSRCQCSTEQYFRRHRGLNGFRDRHAELPIERRQCLLLLPYAQRQCTAFVFRAIGAAHCLWGREARQQGRRPQQNATTRPATSRAAITHATAMPAIAPPDSPELCSPELLSHIVTSVRSHSFCTSAWAATGYLVTWDAIGLILCLAINANITTGGGRRISCDIRMFSTSAYSRQLLLLLAGHDTKLNQSEA